MNKNYTVIIILVIIILALVGFIWWNSQQPKGSEAIIKEVIKDIDIVSDLSKIASKEFINSDHKITLNYPENWQEKDLGSEKNITEALKRENIAFFYLPGTQVSSNDFTTSLVSVKLLRFVLAPDTKINSQGDWYNYIDKLVKEYQNNPVLSSDYQLLSLDKGEKIDNKYVIVENYLEQNSSRGKDYYIYADGELYQFVTKSPKDYFDKFSPYIEKIVTSFKKD